MVNDGKGSGDSEKDGRRPTGKANAGSGVGRRSFLKATGAGATAAALAGCTFNSDSTPTGDGGDGDGGGNQSDGGDGGASLSGTHTIGVLAPVPSENPIGASIANGARLAVQQINDSDLLGDATLEVSVKDTKEDPATGRSKYQELTVGEKVDATVGVFTSEVLLNIMNDIASQQTVHLTTGAATPEASHRVSQNYEQYKYHFRTGPINAHHLGVNLVDFINAKSGDLGWNSVYVLVEDYEWTKPVSSVLNQRLSNAGVEVKGNTRYASGTENFTPIYDKVGNSGADAAFIAMAHTGTAAVLQWRKQQRPFHFGGIHVPMQLPSYYGAVKGACRYGVTQNSATPQSKVTDKTVPFSNAYNQQFNSYPVYTGYITFDAVKQWANVVAQQGSFEADPVISGLEQSSYTGTVGTVEYYPKGHQFAHDVKYEKELVYPIYQQWQESGGSGVQEVIFPDDLATAEYQAPPWV